MRSLPIDDEQVLDYMLTEYETLRNVRAERISLGESRVNFFMATVSGAILGLALISQLAALGEAASLVAGIVLISLLLLGIITFVREVERDISVTIYSRGMNRIRRFFAQLNSDITTYLVLPTEDDTPSFNAVGFQQKGALPFNLAGMIALINSTIVSIGILLFVKVVLSASLEWATAGSLVAFVIGYSLHNRYHAARLKNMEKITEVRFPEAVNGKSIPAEVAGTGEVTL